jgi:hypothetical protein
LVPTTADTENVEGASGAQSIEAEGSESGTAASQLDQAADPVSTEEKAPPMSDSDETGAHPSS